MKPKGHTGTISLKTVTTRNSQMLSICVKSQIVLHSVDIVVCVWRLLLVCIDGLDFICKEMYIPLSNFRLVTLGYCWNLIKLESIFLQFF